MRFMIFVFFFFFAGFASSASERSPPADAAQGERRLERSRQEGACLAQERALLGIVHTGANHGAEEVR